jgi:hypothetical protein
VMTFEIWGNGRGKEGGSLRVFSLGRLETVNSKAVFVLEESGRALYACSITIVAVGVGVCV